MANDGHLHAASGDLPSLTPVRPVFSLLRMGLPGRLLLAVAMSALLWVVVIWALGA